MTATQQQKQSQTSNRRAQVVIDTKALEQAFQSEAFQIKQLPNYFHERRHEIVTDIPKRQVVDWRMSQRLKTVHVALVLCLNIGVDPPDVIRVHPCAKLEAWTDPFSLPHQRALDAIGNNLKAQYERWQPRARYKQCLDPTVEEIQKTCKNLRRSAKKERILFHYNGHGVPKPSVNGEVWVFNKNFTEYIPLSLYDLSSWMDSPSIYVFDCSSAGTVLETFVQVFKQKEKDSGRSKAKDNIILAACSPNETLPMNPNFPADLFTSCLTTPIKIALRWFCENNRLINGITVDMIEHLPGRINDRRTPLGELNWIFTAVTDTIAWNVLPRDLFHKLFRQDLLVASLFRNFLLADRIMRTANCTPMSFPKLPPTHNHEMWSAWDLALDMCISQLPKLIQNPLAEYEYSSFFASELTDFEVWLNFGQRKQEAPKQLPILLQVLLSQAHRLRALTLLGRFLDMGPWAVNLSLSVGIFPYVLKLLQSNSPDLKQVLVFIWAKILSVDPSCQYDLVKDNGHIYFINIITNRANDYKLRTMACFVLTVIVDRFYGGQLACLHYNNLLNLCASQFSEKSPELRLWLCLLIGKLIESYPDAQLQALNQNLHEKVAKLLSDKVPEVRAAAVYCLQCFVRNKPREPVDPSENTQEEDMEPISEERIVKEMQVGALLYQVILDGSPLVRRELTFALSTFIDRFGEHISPDLLRAIIDEYAFTPVVSTNDTSGKKKKKKKKGSEKVEQKPRPDTVTSNPRDMKDRDLGNKSYFVLDLCRVIIMLCSDPMPAVSSLANQVLKYLRKNFLRHSNVTIPAEDDKSKKHSSISLATSPNHRSRSPIHSILSPNPAQRISNRFFIRRSVSETDINQISRAQQQQQLLAQQEAAEDVTLPNSIYYEWCSEYFAAPLLEENITDQSCNLFGESKLSASSFAPAENTESANNDISALYSNVTKKTLKRRKRQDQLIYERQILVKNVSQPSVAKRKLEDQIGFFGNETDIVSHMKFHPVEPWLIVADERDGVSIWNWVKGTKVTGWTVSSTFRAPVTITHHHSQSSFVGVGSHGSTSSVSSDEDSHDTSVEIQYNPDPIFGDMRITDFQLLNEHCADERSLLLVATSRGNVCFYQNYHHRHPRMISAIKAAPEVISRDQGPGVLTCWQQKHGTLIVGGDLEHVKIWDMNREWCVQSIPLLVQQESTTACVTSITCDQTMNHDQLFATGLSDGSVLLFDKRTNSKYSAVARLKEKGDDEWIVNTHMQKLLPNTVISGSSSGIVKFWDTRHTEQSIKTIDINDNSNTASLLTSDALYHLDENLLSGGGSGGASAYTRKSQKSCMTALAVHDYAPVIACGSNNQFIKVLNTSGETLSMIYYHDGFLGQRIGPVSSLAFHPYRLCLAAGSTDSIISLYASSAT